MRVRLAAVSFVIFGLALGKLGVGAYAQGAKIEVTPQISHSDFVHAVAFSSDGTLALSGSQDHTLKLWDVATGQLIRTFEGHVQPVSSVAISRDGARMLSGGYDKTLRLWDAVTGHLIRTIKAHAESVESVAFSPDGKRLLSSSGIDTKLWDADTGQLIRTFKSSLPLTVSPDGIHVLTGSPEKKLKLWDGKSGQPIRSFEGYDDFVSAVAFLPDGSRALSVNLNRELKLWAVQSGHLIRTIPVHVANASAVTFSSDGRRLLGGGQETLKLWNTATGELIRTFEGHSGTSSAHSVAISPNGKLVLSGTKLWDAASGQLTREFEAEAGSVDSVAISPDNARLLSGGQDKTLKVWNAVTGQLIRSIKGHDDAVRSVAFSPDGTRLLSGSSDGNKLWDSSSGQLIRSFDGDGSNTTAFSRDGTRILTSGLRVELWNAATGHLIRAFGPGLGALSSNGTRALTSVGEGLAGTTTLWDAKTGQLLRTFHEYAQAMAFSPDGTRMLWVNMYGSTPKLLDVAGGQLIRTFKGHTDFVTSIAFAPKGKQLLTGSWDKTLKLWDVNTGQLIRTFQGHLGRVQSVAFSADGRRVVSGSVDTTVRVWDVASGRNIATLVGGRGGEWLTTTPSGFFAGTRDINKLLGIIRRFEVTSIDQVHQSLFNPDLVREALADDPNGEVKRGAEVLNLDKVIDSGPAPLVAIAPPPGGSRSADDLLEVTAHIEDRGKGVGRIEWRVNGITAAVAERRSGSGPASTITRQLALDPGDNIIEVVAYNESNLLASLPARTTVKVTGAADWQKPKLHILAIGINSYVDKGWVERGRIRRGFPPLTLAVKDAERFATEMTHAAGSLFDVMPPTLVLDKDATRDNIDKVVASIAKDISPRDTFILFAAAHGTTENGRFYLIPQDYQGGPGTLQERAIGQDQLQDWLANRVKAKKALILLDTCESGAVVAGHLRSRTEEAASEAGVGRLHEATGRPVLTAAATGQFAREGLITASGERQGFFTHAILNALKNGDTNGNGTIELSELVAYVQDAVPKLAEQNGGTGRAETATPRRQGQSARFGSRGEDFAVASRVR